MVQVTNTIKVLGVGGPEIEIYGRHGVYVLPDDVTAWLLDMRGPGKGPLGLIANSQEFAGIPEFEAYKRDQLALELTAWSRGESFALQSLSEWRREL